MERSGSTRKALRTPKEKTRRRHSAVAVEHEFGEYGALNATRSSRRLEIMNTARSQRKLKSVRLGRLSTQKKISESFLLKQAEMEIRRKEQIELLENSGPLVQNAYILLFGDSPEARFLQHGLLAIIIVNSLIYTCSTIESWAEAAPWFFYGVEMFVTFCFTIEYICRCITAHLDYDLRTSNESWKPWANYIVSIDGIIDLVAISPFWIELITDTNLPTLTMVRLLRIFQVLRLEKYTRAVKSLVRVVYHNREILGSAVTLAFILLYFTSTGLYFKNRHTDPEQYGSIPQAMYLGVLMLTGQGEPEGEMDAATKVVVVITALGSVPLFAIFAAMLGWGFEAEAEYFLKERKRRRKKIKKDYPRRNSNTAADTHPTIKPFNLRKGLSHDELMQYIPSDISSSTPVWDTSSHYETSSDSGPSSSESEEVIVEEDNDLESVKRKLLLSTQEKESLKKDLLEVTSRLNQLLQSQLNEKA